MHPEINEIGYHCRDYFLAQWDRFSRLPLGRARALDPPARRRHLRPGARRAAPGCTVTLATGIPEDVVRAANLDYLDPADVDLAAEAADPQTLVVPDAGEVLYRLTDG